MIIKEECPLVIPGVPRHLLFLRVPSSIPFLTGKPHSTITLPTKPPQQSLLDSLMEPCVYYIVIHSVSRLWTSSLFLKFPITTTEEEEDFQTQKTRVPTSQKGAGSRGHCCNGDESPSPHQVVQGRPPLPLHRAFTASGDAKVVYSSPTNILWMNECDTRKLLLYSWGDIQTLGHFRTTWRHFASVISLPSHRSVVL